MIAHEKTIPVRAKWRRSHYPPRRALTLPGASSGPAVPIRPPASTLATAFALAAVVLLAAIAAPARAQMPPTGEFPKTDFEERIVDLSEFMSGGPPRDGIPAVDEPRYTSTEDAAQWLDPDEPVIAAEIDGEARAYPLQILIWHEIANDSLGGTPIAVTFCPLCNSAIVFDRRLDGEVLDFGTTGRLRLSDLVMYDRQTETWWQQLTGTGLIGEHAGRELVRLPAAIVSWHDFRAAFPDATVLSRATGHSRPYGSNPYAGYDSSTQPFLLQRTPDPRLPAMERVLHVAAGGTERIYPFGAFTHEPVINDEGGGRARGRDESERDPVGSRRDPYRRLAPDPLLRRVFAPARGPHARVRASRREDRRHRHRFGLEPLRRGGGRSARGKPPRSALARRALRVCLARVPPRRGRVRRFRSPLGHTAE